MTRIFLKLLALFAPGMLRSRPPQSACVSPFGRARPSRKQGVKGSPRARAIAARQCASDLASEPEQSKPSFGAFGPRAARTGLKI